MDKNEKKWRNELADILDVYSTQIKKGLPQEYWNTLAILGDYLFDKNNPEYVIAHALTLDHGHASNGAWWYLKGGNLFRNRKINKLLRINKSQWILGFRPYTLAFFCHPNVGPLCNISPKTEGWRYNDSTDQKKELTVNNLIRFVGLHPERQKRVNNRDLQGVAS